MILPVIQPGQDEQHGAEKDDLGGDFESFLSHTKVLFTVLVFVLLLVPVYTILEPLPPP